MDYVALQPLSDALSDGLEGTYLTKRLVAYRVPQPSNDGMAERTPTHALLRISHITR